MKKIFTAAMGVILIVPLVVTAATFSFSPALGNYKPGDTISTSVFVNPGSGETITATKLSLTYPSDKLELLSYIPVNGAPILAHVGTDTSVAGKIVDNIAFNPGITVSTKVATVTFKAKADGVANLAVASDAKLLDAGNTDKTVGAPVATFTVSTPAPAPEPEPQTQPEVKPTTRPNVGVNAGSNTDSNTIKKPSVSKEQQEEGQASNETKEATSTDMAIGTGELVIDNNELDELDTQQEAAAAGAGTGYNWLRWLLAVLGLLVAIWFFLFGKKKEE